MARSSELLIQLRGVAKRYGTKTAVHDLSLNIPAGELFACLGPNGAGKTTTIKMMMGLLRPTVGEVVVAGHNMTSIAAEARRCIAYVPDQPFLYEKLTGREILHFLRDLHGMTPAQARRREEQLIDTFELADFVDYLTETYSHGMRQRLAFAAAMLHEPKVLIVDEPMVGLDPRSVRLVKTLLCETARQGTTVFMSTHTLAIAEEIADRIGIMHRGRLIHCGTLHELRRQAAGDPSLEEFFLAVTAEEAA